ncbi:thermonuclease family protein [Nitratireductor sp. ZSWI3]|uniref:thermonuclease family protein n=1 Tax=Nitratireductor sp. ZSWI3 TaxID=2966359 RepID=UPI00214F98A3|nr:thermonuclease family protein [Nitratireductor sp. ZSWI3]MCR4267369.1 thermonuclease family protein [Nitratireductor sp. ZSWI3]
MGLLRIFIRLFTTSDQKPDYLSWQEIAADYVERAKQNPHLVTVIRGRCWVIDGDTVVINRVRIRLAGIDAPELDHPWGRKSKWALAELCKGQIVTAQIKPELSYDRVVAECFLPDRRDLAAELVRRGLALDWPKFSGGKYRHLEPPDARRKLWCADARQNGRWPLNASSGWS